MAIYTVELKSNERMTVREGADVFVVSAATEADAEAVAKAQYGGALSAAAWDNATTTVRADVASNADDALVGYRFHITVSDPSDGSVVADVTFTGTAADDTIDTIGDELVTLLNATASIANAAYVGATQTLTVASGGGGDDLGDHAVQCNVYVPAVTDTNGDEITQKVGLPGFVSSITDEGVASAALTVVFGADTLVRPTVLAKYKQV